MHPAWPRVFPIHRREAPAKRALARRPRGVQRQNKNSAFLFSPRVLRHACATECPRAVCFAIREHLNFVGTWRRQNRSIRRKRRQPPGSYAFMGQIRYLLTAIWRAGHVLQASKTLRDGRTEAV